MEGLTEISSAQVLASEDEHDQTDREKERRDQCNQAWVFGPQASRSTLDQLNDHGSETQLSGQHKKENHKWIGTYDPSCHPGFTECYDVSLTTFLDS